MKKQILIIIVLLIGSIICDAQTLTLTNYGVNSNMKITNNAYVNIVGSFVNTTSATTVNDGTIKLTETTTPTDFTNNSVFTSGVGSNVKLEGAVQHIKGITTTFENLFIDGIDDKTIDVSTNVNNSLNFVANKIIIVNNNLVLFPNAVINNSTNQKYVVTNGSGFLVKNSMPISSPFLFPVGDATTSYQPATINNTGTIDNFNVRVEAGLQPTTDDNTTCVQYTWVIEEDISGGSNAFLRLGWDDTPFSQTDEGISFQKPYASVWQYTNGAWHIALGNDQGSPTTGNINETQYWNELMTNGVTDFSTTSNRFIVRSLRILEPSDTALCYNSLDSVFLSVGDSGGMIQFQWQVNCNNTGWVNVVDGTTYQGANTPDLAVYLLGLSANDNCEYQCILTNLLGTTTIGPYTLDIYPMIQAQAFNDTTIFLGQQVQLDATGGNTYLWVPSTYLNNPNISNPICEPTEDITYIVYVTGANGCVGTDTITIDVETSSDIFVPDAFSPNGDNSNELLFVYGQGIKDIYFVVYDRWGEKIFETSDQKHGWDGTYKGKKLSKAVFVYYVKATYWDENKVEKKGNVTLIR